MDFVTGVETANTRQQVQDLATKTSPELRRIMKSTTDEVVQGTHIINPMGQRIPFCSGQDRKKARTQAKTVIGVAQTVHKILSKTLAQQVPELTAQEAR